MASRMLLIVGSCEPLYEAEFTQSNAPKQSEETAHLNQFILHSAMDMVDMAMEEKADMCASRPRHSRRDARNAAGTCASSTSSTTRTSSRTSRRDRSSSGREPNDSANSFERSVEKETSTRAHDPSKHEPKRLRFDRDREGLTFRWTGPTQVKFLLLHEGRNEDAVRNFFLEVHELYVKLVMNPFYEHDTPITSPTFDRAVHALARRHL